jgi:hypothetical protein
MAICCTKDSLINIATTAVLNFVVFDIKNSGFCFS